MMARGMRGEEERREVRGDERVGGMEWEMRKRGRVSKGMMGKVE